MFRLNDFYSSRHGHNERVFRLEYVSNSEISDAEFQRWRETTMKQVRKIFFSNLEISFFSSFQSVSLPTLQVLENKMKEIDKCKHYVYNNNDISKIVEEKRRFRKAPINYAVTKNELLKEIV
jgi:RNA polymerase-associated protein RTF1